MDSIEELRADIAADVHYAGVLMAEITDALAKGSFAYASVKTDYLQGRIKSAERTQKRITKLEAAHKRIEESQDVADVLGALADFERGEKA